MKSKKKNFDYFATLCTMSDFAVREAELLKEILTDFHPERLEEQRHRMHELEHGCDTVKHDLTTALVHEFLPPVDREDLFRLAHVADNLADSVDGVVGYLYMADIRCIRPDVGAFSDLTIECCRNAAELLREFRNFKKSVRLKDLIILINDLEEKGDKLYTDAVRRLSKDAPSTRDLIEWWDLYRKFENCFDAAESIADNVESVVMKNT